MSTENMNEKDVENEYALCRYNESKHDTEGDIDWETGYQGLVKVKRAYKKFAEKEIEI